MSWTVYRVLDAEGTCIYAGVTTNLKRRWSAHRSKLEGASEIVEFDVYDNECDALTAEAIVIDAERPRHNKRDNPSHGAEPESDREKIARLTQTLVRRTLDHHRFMDHALRPLPASELFRRLSYLMERQEMQQARDLKAAA